MEQELLLEQRNFRFGFKRGRQYPYVCYESGNLMEEQEPTIGFHLAGRTENDTVADHRINQQTNKGSEMQAPQIDSMRLFIVVVKFEALDHVTE